LVFSWFILAFRTAGHPTSTSHWGEADLQVYYMKEQIRKKKCVGLARGLVKKENLKHKTHVYSFS
jgi:hypothetical protein